MRYLIEPEKKGHAIRGEEKIMKTLFNTTNYLGTDYDMSIEEENQAIEESPRDEEDSDRSDEEEAR